jgi:hypothetical protein
MERRVQSRAVGLRVRMRKMFAKTHNHLFRITAVIRVLLVLRCAKLGTRERVVSFWSGSVVLVGDVLGGRGLDASGRGS